MCGSMDSPYRPTPELSHRYPFLLPDAVVQLSAAPATYGWGEVIHFFGDTWRNLDTRASWPPNLRFKPHIQRRWCRYGSRIVTYVYMRYIWVRGRHIEYNEVIQKHDYAQRSMRFWRLSANKEKSIKSEVYCKPLYFIGDFPPFFFPLCKHKVRKR